MAVRAACTTGVGSAREAARRLSAWPPNAAAHASATLTPAKSKSVASAATSTVPTSASSSFTGPTESSPATGDIQSRAACAAAAAKACPRHRAARSPGRGRFPPPNRRPRGCAAGPTKPRPAGKGASMMSVYGNPCSAVLWAVAKLVLGGPMERSISFRADRSFFCQANAAKEEKQDEGANLEHGGCLGVCRWNKRVASAGPGELRRPRRPRLLPRSTERPSPKPRSSTMWPCSPRSDSSSTLQRSRNGASCAWKSCTF